MQQNRNDISLDTLHNDIMPDPLIFLVKYKLDIYVTQKFFLKEKNLYLRL